MTLHMSLRRLSDHFLAILHRDGWLTFATDGDGREFDVSHPQVKDEQAARSRLNHLGLLISGSLRIEFPAGPGTRLHADECALKMTASEA